MASVAEAVRDNAQNHSSDVAATKPAVSPFRMMDLPPELRSRISYYCVIGSSNDGFIDVDVKSPTPGMQVLQVGRQLRNETIGLYYSLLTFRIHARAFKTRFLGMYSFSPRRITAQKWLEAIGDEAKQRIEALLFADWDTFELSGALPALRKLQSLKRLEIDLEWDSFTRWRCWDLYPERRLRPGAFARLWWREEGDFLNNLSKLRGVEFFQLCAEKLSVKCLYCDPGPEEAVCLHCIDSDDENAAMRRLSDRIRRHIAQPKPQGYGGVVFVESLPETSCALWDEVEQASTLGLRGSWRGQRM